MNIDTANAYEVLGLAPTATALQIKAVGRAMLKEFHTDVGGDLKEAQTINWAIQELLDPDRRAKLDAQLAQNKQTPPAANATPKYEKPAETAAPSSTPPQPPRTDSDNSPLRHLYGNVERRREIAKRSDDKELLKKLAYGDTDNLVLFWVANNPNTFSYVLDSLSKNNDPKIRAAVLYNKSTLRSVRERLMSDAATCEYSFVALNVTTKAELRTRIGLLPKGALDQHGSCCNGNRHKSGPGWAILLFGPAAFLAVAPIEIMQISEGWDFILFGVLFILISFGGGKILGVIRVSLQREKCGCDDPASKPVRNVKTVKRTPKTYFSMYSYPAEFRP